MTGSTSSIQVIRKGDLKYALARTDSLVAEVQPGEIFVHRNIANIVHPTDLSVQSILQFGPQGG